MPYPIYSKEDHQAIENGMKWLKENNELLYTRIQKHIDALDGYIGSLESMLNKFSDRMDVFDDYQYIVDGLREECQQIEGYPFFSAEAMEHIMGLTKDCLELKSKYVAECFK